MAKTTLGPVFRKASGKLGNVVIVRSREGTVIRELVIPRNPQTPAQIAVRTALKKSAQAFETFNAAQEAEWERYAQREAERDDVTGKVTNPTAINAFVGLAAKFLQVTPNGTIPLTPPATDYNGDSVTVTATAGTGKVTFTASGPNTAGTRTELLLQPLASRNRNPQKKGYRTKAFVSFVPGTLSFDVTVPPGWYAAAYRFVNVATGQDTRLVEVPVVQVALAVSGSGVGSGLKKKAA
jgi:hypothetical protein